MHRALCISEIFREVLLYASEQCISDEHYNSVYVCPWHASGDEHAYCTASCAYDIEAKTQRRPTPRHRFLHGVALSCKTFSCVALDLLWRVLDSPEPLRDLQHHFVRQGVEIDSLDTCKQYCTYTHRIRGIYFGMDVSLSGSDRHDSVRGRERTNELFILPRLRSIRIDVPPSSTFQRPLGLLTKSLVEVSLSFVGGQSYWAPERAVGYVDSYLRALADQPFLQTLELDWVPSVPDPGLITCLARLSTLKIAMVASIVDSLPLLTALHEPCIPHIRICVEQAGFDWPVMDYSRTNLGGPIELHLLGSPTTICFDRVIELLSAGTNGSELELHLSCEIEYPDSSAFAGSGSLLSSTTIGALVSAMRCPRSTLAMALRALDIEDPLTDTDDVALTFSSIQPLLKVQQMVRFEIAANVPFSLCDADVAVLARAWPNLEALEVRLYHDTLQGSALLPKRCPTLRSLCALARHCPRLGSLYIPFRAAIDGVPEDEWPKPGDAHRALRCLTLDGGEVLCGEGQEVGVALEELFPYATVDTRSAFDMAAWDQVIEAKLRHRLYAMMR